MKSSKKYFEQLAKTLFKKSITAGTVDEEKVRIILKELSSKKPIGLSSILKTYKRLIAHKLTEEQLTIETNDKITLQKSFTENLKKRTGARKILNKTNPNIVFGARIYHGDWIWDNTLEGKLKQLINQ